MGCRQAAPITWRTFAVTGFGRCAGCQSVPDGAGGRFGKRYAMFVPASLAGSYGPPVSALAGHNVDGDSGFVVPESLPAPVSSGPLALNRALIAGALQLPIADMPPTPEPRELVIVQLTGARYSSDATQSSSAAASATLPSKPSRSPVRYQSAGRRLARAGQIHRPAVALGAAARTESGLYHPVARPPAGTATFRMMQSSFELSGLQ